MTQTFLMLNGNQIERTYLPDPSDLVLPGIKWGQFHKFFTPAYWFTQVFASEKQGLPESTRLGKTLAEEIAACILGGYGMRAELGLLAFRRLKKEGIFSDTPTKKHIVSLLEKPLIVGNRSLRYRYPHKRGHYIFAALDKLAKENPPNDDNTFREWLLDFEGIGPKTASWITRNWLGSDFVAIIDVHVRRAGILLGIFREEMQPSRHYTNMEQIFLEFASAIHVKASILDAVIWSHMRRMRRTALLAVSAKNWN